MRPWIIETLFFSLYLADSQCSIFIKWYLYSQDVCLWNEAIYFIHKKIRGNITEVNLAKSKLIKVVVC